MFKLHLQHVSFLLLFSIAAGALRQLAPQGIAWNGRWPTSSTSAEEAYNMMAKPGDPPFIGFADVIRHQQEKVSVFLDARSSKEFAEGRIPGARSLPYYEIEAHQQKALEGLTADSSIIIYCEGVGCELSFFLGRDLQAAGYKNIRIFYGGYPEWKNAGLPVEK